MPVVGAFPYDLNNLLGGAVRVLWAPIASALPTKPSDVFLQKAPYNPIGGAYVSTAVSIGGTSITVNDATSLPASGSLYVSTQSGAVTLASKTGNVLTVSGVTAAIPAGTYIHTLTAWRDLGATREAFSYGRNIEIGAYQIQQVTGNVLEEVTQTERTARASVAEINAENLTMLEQGHAGTNVDGGSAIAYDQVNFGTIHELEQYRVAYVSRRAKQAGVVTEAGTLERGRFVIGVGYRGQVSAENVAIAQAKGELSSAQLTFRFFPEPTGVAEGEEFGTWWLERARAIA